MRVSAESVSPSEFCFRHFSEQKDEKQVVFVSVSLSFRSFLGVFFLNIYFLSFDKNCCILIQDKFSLVVR